CPSPRSDVAHGEVSGSRDRNRLARKGSPRRAHEAGLQAKPNVAAARCTAVAVTESLAGTCPTAIVGFHGLLAPIARNMFKGYSVDPVVERVSQLSNSPVERIPCLLLGRDEP